MAASRHDANRFISSERARLSEGIRAIDVALRGKQNNLDTVEATVKARSAEIHEMTNNYERKVMRDVMECRSRIAEKAADARRLLESDMLKLNCIEGVMSVTPSVNEVSNRNIEICDIDALVSNFKRIPVNVDSSLTKNGYETVDAMLGRMNIITPIYTPAPVFPVPATAIPPATPALSMMSYSGTPRMSGHIEQAEWNTQTIQVSSPSPREMSNGSALALQQTNETTVDHYINHMTSTPDGGLVTANYNGEDIFLYDSQLKHRSQIRMEWYCWGVACDGDGHLYIATGSDLRRYKISGSTYECTAVDKNPFTLGVYEVFIKGNRIYTGGEKVVNSYVLNRANVNDTSSTNNDIIDARGKESYDVGGHVTAIAANNQGHVFAVTDRNNLYMFRRFKDGDVNKKVRDKLTFSVLVTLKGVVCPDDSCVLLMGSKDERSMIGWQSTVWSVPITQRGLLPALPIMKLDERIKACALSGFDSLVLATVDSANQRRLRVYKIGHSNLTQSTEFDTWSSNIFLP